MTIGDNDEWLQRECVCVRMKWFIRHWTRCCREPQEIQCRWIVVHSDAVTCPQQLDVRLLRGRIMQSPTIKKIKLHGEKIACGDFGC